MTKRWKILLGIAIALVIPAVINLIFWPDHIYWVSLPGLGILFVLGTAAILGGILFTPFIIFGFLIEAVEWLNSK